jgi:predicted permease
MLTLRLLRKAPAFSALTILSLALGVGCCAAVFSIFNGLFLRSLPYPHAERLIHIQEAVPSLHIAYRPVATYDLQAWTASSAFSHLAGFHEDGSYLQGFGATVRVNVANVTQSMASTLGIAPVLGRDFLPEEDRLGSPWESGAAHRVALLSHGLWQRYFGGSPDVLGKPLHVDDRTFTIVGVLPRTAVYPPDADVWVLGGYGQPGTNTYLHHAVGRLKPGVTAAQAAADLIRLQKGTVAARPNNRFIVPVAAPLRDAYLANYRAVSQILLGAVAFVLLIACLNVAGLMLARGTGRAQEFAVRSALGANRATLVRQLLSETLLMAAAAGAVGAFLGWAAVSGMKSFLATLLPSWVEFGLDFHFFWLVLAITATVGVLAGLAPAFSVTNLRPNLAARRRMNLLVTGEIALAVILLAGGALVLKAFHRVMSVAPGFQAENAVAFSVDPPGANNDPEPPRRRLRFVQDVLMRLRATHGIDAAGMADALPFSAARNLLGAGVPLFAEGQSGDPATAPLAEYRRVTPGYFRAMGTPLLEGRDFDEHDGATAAVINQALARRYWPGAASVAGKRLLHPYTKARYTVVGVVGDVRSDGLERDVRPQFFSPYAANVFSYLNVVVRGRMPASALTAAAREAARETDPAVAIFDVQTLRGMLDRTLGTRRAYTWLFGVFAAVALLLAVGGIYGVISYSIAQQTREIGIRMALGAQRTHVIGGVLRGGLRLAAAGVALGVTGAWFAVRLLAGVLAGVSPHDPLVYSAVVCLLMAAALLAALVPARRAASVDPLRAIKAD